jgi:hypothetical protein
MCDPGEDILDTLKREFKEEVTNSKKKSEIISVSETPEKKEKRKVIENAVDNLFKNGVEVF